MSNSYLTFTDMNMIADLLEEVLGKDFRTDSESTTGAARLLIKNFEAGLMNKDALRYVLRKHLQIPYCADTALSRWDSEGGAIPLRHDARYVGLLD
jgi:hypothetical protein